MHANDRFFIQRTHCFNVLGHSEQINFKKENKNGQVIIGDDLGSECYFHLLTKLIYNNVYLLKEWGIKPFIFNEIIYYPSAFKRNQFLKDVRIGLGIGLSMSLPINQFLNLHIYNNLFVFGLGHEKNGKKIASFSDIIRAGTFEIEIGLF